MELDDFLKDFVVLYSLYGIIVVLYSGFEWFLMILPAFNSESLARLPPEGHWPCFQRVLAHFIGQGTSEILRSTRSLGPLSVSLGFVENATAGHCPYGAREISEGCFFVCSAREMSGFDSSRPAGASDVFEKPAPVVGGSRKFFVNIKSA